jgi:hypothetical protein
MLSKPTTLNQQCTKCRNVKSKANKNKKNRNQMANMNKKSIGIRKQQKPIAKGGGGAVGGNITIKRVENLEN